MRTLEFAMPLMGTRTPEMTNPARRAAERGSNSIENATNSRFRLRNAHYVDPLGRECNSGRSAGRIFTPEPPKDLASI